MNSSRIRGLRHRCLVVLAAGAGSVALWPAAAHASTLGSSASCPAAATSQAFSQWGDSNQYTLAPGGNFASPNAGWTLTGGAKIVSTQVPWNLGGAGTAGALYMPPGSTAKSPYMCVDASDPTYRFLAANTAGAGGLTSQAVYATALGLAVPLTLSRSQAPASWGPVAALYTGAAPASALSGGTARMSLHFQSSGYSQIDDVFVDPHMRG